MLYETHGSSMDMVWMKSRSNKNDIELNSWQIYCLRVDIIFLI